jgi:hypothetical protein
MTIGYLRVQKRLRLQRRQVVRRRAAHQDQRLPGKARQGRVLRQRLVRRQRPQMQARRVLWVPEIGVQVFKLGADI